MTANTPALSSSAVRRPAGRAANSGRREDPGLTAPPEGQSQEEGELHQTF